LHRFSSAMVLSAMVPLALGIASLVFFYGLWFGLTLGVRLRVSSRAVR
jgi:hypothetical protein